MKCALCSKVALAMFFLLGQPPARPQELAKTARPKVTPTAPYPNSADGLRLLLQHVMAAAKRGDDVTVETEIRDMEIPDYVNWFANTFGEEQGKSWSQPYGTDLRKNEKQLQALLIQLAQKEGEISATKVDSYAKPGSLDWGLSHGLKHPADFYLAEFRSAELPKSAAGDFIGYFVFVGGRFRWDSTIQVVKLLPMSTTGVQSFSVVAKQSEDQSDSGTVYMSDLYKLTLRVPQDWHTNDALARAQFGIGAFSSQDETINMLIQQMPGARDPSDFVKEFDARGGRLFAGYHKISESQMLVDDKNCEALEFQFTDTRQGADGLVGSVPLQSWMVFIAIQRGLLVFNFVTSSSLFDSEKQTFREIVMSYGSTATTQAAPSQ